MRRLPAIVWILAPVVLGLLYAAGHEVLAPEPTLADLPPRDAILVHRVRGLDMLDATWPGPRGPDLRAPRESLGRERNNPGLVGVDHRDWVHLVLMPRGRVQDSTMAIFRLDDPQAFEREFMRTDFLERGLIRHAQHLRIQDGWAAVGPQRDATRRLGTGGITCEDRGEDWSMATHVPDLVDHALLLAKDYPWREPLEALGVDVASATVVRDPQSGAVRAVLRGDKRIERLRSAWRTARLWAWHADGRLRVELAPSPGSAVADALAALPGVDPRRDEAEPHDAAWVPPGPPPGAQAWLHLPFAEERVLLAQVLLACGVRFVGEAPDVDPLGGMGARAPRGGLLLWAERGAGTGYAMTVGLAAREGHMVDLSAFLPLPAAAEGSRELPEGAAPLVVGDTTSEREVPAGTVERRRVGGLEVVTFGPSAHAAAEGMRAAAAAGQLDLPPLRDAWAGEVRRGRPVARFFLGQRRAERVLGRALEPGGLLAMLAGGDIHGVVEAEEGKIVLRAWVVR